MFWRIASLELPLNMVVRPGDPPVVLRDGLRDLCHIVVARQQPNRPAVILGSCYAVQAGGPVHSPLVVIAPQGGRLLFSRGTRIVRVEITPANSDSYRPGEVCPLCRVHFVGGEPTRNCKRCDRAFHRDCLAGAARCPNCLASLTPKELQS